MDDEDLRVHWKDLFAARSKAFDLAVAHGMIGTMESLEKMAEAKVEYSAICHRAIAWGVRGLGDD